MSNKIIPLRRVAKHKKRRLQRRIAQFATQIPIQYLDEAKIWSRDSYGPPIWSKLLRNKDSIDRIPSSFCRGSWHGIYNPVHYGFDLNEAAELKLRTDLNAQL